MPVNPSAAELDRGLAALLEAVDRFAALGTGGEFGVSAFDLVLAVFLGLAVLALLAALRWLIGLIPMGKARRAALARGRPVVELLTAIAYVVVAIPLVFGGPRQFTPLLAVLAALVVGLFALSWSALRDFVGGAFIKAGQLCSVGDRVEIEGRGGIVKRLGYRLLTLETDEGAEVFVPYAQLSRRSIVRLPRVEGAHRHSFEVELPAGLDSSAAIARIKRLALSSHWSSLIRDPEVEPLAGGRVEVHVFALGREHGPDVEADVRRGLSSGDGT